MTFGGDVQGRGEVWPCEP